MRNVAAIWLLIFFLAISSISAKQYGILDIHFDLRKDVNQTILHRSLQNSSIAPNNTTIPKGEVYHESAEYKGVSKYLVRTIMLAVIKTPGKCELVDSIRVGSSTGEYSILDTYSHHERLKQSIAGENQDFMLGELIKEKFTDFIYDTLQTEKNVYALATRNDCHWMSLQNMCRSMFLQMKETEVSSENLEKVLIPPGGKVNYFNSKTNHAALPNGFWPVAIRSDDAEQILFDKMEYTCPLMHDFIENDAKFGILKNLSETAQLSVHFERLKSEINSQSIKYRIKNQIDFMNIENLFEEIQYKNLDGQMEETTYSLLQDFYWMFMYAKYASNTQVQVALARPLLNLLLEKIGYLDLNPGDEKHNRDKLMMFSVSNKVMTAFNAFVYRYSHECFVQRILEGSSTRKNHCPGKISPTSNLIFKIDQVNLEQYIGSFIEGEKFELCRSANSEECKLDYFVELMKKRMEGFTHMPCTKKKIIILTGFWDFVMAKIVLLLFIIVCYYVIRCALLLKSNPHLRPQSTLFYRDENTPKSSAPENELKKISKPEVPDEDTFKLKLDTI